jgi:carbonic anhydrase
MSCSKATAPVNITNNTTTTCDLKCDYSFKYPISNLQATNRGNYLSLKTEPESVPPVTYNAEQYQVYEIRIYRPSLHTYGGKNADAEMIIVHNSSSGSEKLLVCIPINKSISASNKSAQTFDTILSTVSKTAPSVNKQTIINLPTFSLNDFVPMKPFYSYNGTLPYAPCNGKYSYVVFSKNNEGALSMSYSAYSSLSKIISATSNNIKNGSGGIYYNSKGPSQSTGLGEDIYIECSPTGSDGETQVKSSTSSPTSLFSSDSVSNVLNSVYFQVIIGAIVILGIMKLGQILLKKLTTVKKISKPSAAAAEIEMTGGRRARTCRTRK